MYCMSGLSIPLIGLRPRPGAESGLGAGSEACYSREVVSLDAKSALSFSHNVQTQKESEGDSNLTKLLLHNAAIYWKILKLCFFMIEALHGNLCPDGLYARVNSFCRGRHAFASVKILLSQVLGVGFHLSSMLR